MSVYNVDKIYHENLNQKTSYINYALEHIDENLNKRNIKFPSKEQRVIIDEAAKLCSKHGASFEAKLLKESDSDEKLCFIKLNNEFRPYFDLKLNENLLKSSKGLAYDDITEEDVNNMIGKKRILENTLIEEGVENFKNTTQKNKINVESKTIITDNLDKIKRIFEDKLTNQIDTNIESFDNFVFSNENSLFDLFKVESPNNTSQDFSFNTIFFRTNLNESITEKQDDILKMTALFVAKNGQNFLNIIQKNESNNSLFNFLNPSNNLFPYFKEILKGYKNISNLNSLWQNKLDVYSKVSELNFHTEKLSELNLKERIEYIKSGKWNGFSDSNPILLKARDTFIIEKQKLEKEKEEKTVKNIENKLISSVCWNNFSIVELIDYDVEERKIKIVKSETINNKEVNKKNEINLSCNKITNNHHNTFDIEKIENEENYNLIDRIKNNKTPNLIVLSADQHLEKLKQMNKKIIISMVNCVFCNRKIPENEYQEHLKIELLDPKWKDVINEINKRKDEKTFNDGDSMVRYLREFKNGRPDLFENSSKDEVVWDGVAAHLSRMTASIAMNNTHNKKLLEENIKNELIKEQKLREIMMLNKDLENSSNFDENSEVNNKNIYTSNLGRN